MLGESGAAGRASGASLQEDPLGKLTPREREVLHWIVEGKANGDIGRILGISSRTVEKHCESIFRKLGIENRYSAIVLALTGHRAIADSR